MFNQLGVIGCGLMGGSFALALKRAGMVRRVIGYSKSPSTTEQAKRLGVIDTAAESALARSCAILRAVDGACHRHRHADVGAVADRAFDHQARAHLLSALAHSHESEAWRLRRARA